MHAKDYSLNAVLEQRQQWVIPVYQRKYAWETGPDKQLPKLWEDMRERALSRLKGEQPRPHFVGAIIYSEPAEQPFGTVNKRFLVDGQQRISTFNLALCALRDVAHERDCQRLVSAISSYVFNPEDRAMADPERERFKLWSSSFDRPYFAAIAIGSTDEIRAAAPHAFYKNGKIIPGAAPKMVAAYWYLAEQMREFVKEEVEQGREAETVIDAILAGFLSGFQIVVVQLGRDDDAQGIFASLNGNAQPLTSFDLVRNDIFHRARKQLEDDDALYDRKWVALEADFWQTEVKQGRLKRPRTDHLVVHTIVAETAKDVNAGQAANEYRSYAKAKAFPSVKKEVENLLKCAGIYEGLERRAPGQPEAKIGKFLHAWDMSAMHPLVLWLGVNVTDTATRVAAYKLVESYVVRRDFCGLTNRNYNQVVPGMLRHVKAGEEIISALETYMTSLTGDASRMPADAEVQAAFVRRPAYLELGPRKLRYLFAAMEQHARTRHDEQVSIETDNLWIEHILPSKWAAHWPLPNGERSPREEYFAASAAGAVVSEETRRLMDTRESAKHTFGNLTVLTSELNGALSHGAWTEKRKAISRSLLALNREVATPEAWDEQTIEQRSQALAALAIKIWPAHILLSPSA